MPIPFLKFPYIVYSEIFQFLPYYEVVEFGTLSKRSAVLVKRYVNAKVFPPDSPILELLTPEPIIGLGNLQRALSDDIRKHKKEVPMFATGLNITRQYKYSGNPLADWMKLVDTLLFVTGRSVSTFAISLLHWAGEFKDIVLWLHAKSRTIPCLLVYSNAHPEAHVTFIMRHLRCKRSLSIDHLVSNNRVFSLVPANLARLNLNGGVRIAQFLKISAANIKVLSTYNRFTAQEINTFLKSWRAGQSHRRLQSLELAINPTHEAERYFANIPHEYQDDDRVINRPFDAPIRGGVDIKRRDGTVATLFTQMDPLGYWKLSMWIAEPE